MQDYDSKEIVVFLIAANIIVAGIAVLFFLSIRIQQKRKQLYQRQLLEKEIRSREQVIRQISRDLHDEVGSSLSGINMLTQLVLHKVENGEFDQTGSILLRIHAYSNEVIDKVNDMAWLLKPGEESMVMMLSKLKKFGTETAAAKSIRFEFQSSTLESFPEISILLRKTIYLISKEAINNAVKYAECTNIHFKLFAGPDKLEWTVSDNGKGFEIEKITPGNGLENMRIRAREAGADFNIQTSPGAGTKLTIALKPTQ